MNQIIKNFSKKNYIPKLEQEESDNDSEEEDTVESIQQFLKNVNKS